LSRFLLNRNWMSRGKSSPLDVVMDTIDTAASWPWNLSKVPTRGARGDQALPDGPGSPRLVEERCKHGLPHCQSPRTFRTADSAGESEEMGGAETCRRWAGASNGSTPISA
jgi:hypothetical protein